MVSLSEMGSPLLDPADLIYPLDYHLTHWHGSGWNSFLGGGRMRLEKWAAQNGRRFAGGREHRGWSIGSRILFKVGHPPRGGGSTPELFWVRPKLEEFLKSLISPPPILGSLSNPPGVLLTCLGGFPTEGGAKKEPWLGPPHSQLPDAGAGWANFPRIGSNGWWIFRLYNTCMQNIRFRSLTKWIVGY